MMISVEEFLNSLREDNRELDFIHEHEEDYYGFKTIVPEKIEERRRWTIFKTAVIQAIDTGKFYRISWDESATTEMQECDPYLSMVEVFPREVTITEYHVN